MLLRSVRDRGARRPLSLLLWGWLMLAVVLLSAMPASGAPRTRWIGSAFDPATISVALSPRIPKAQASAAKLEKKRPVDHHIGSPPGPLCGASSAIARRAIAGQRHEFGWSGHAATSHRPLVRANAPRAPPAA